MEQDSEQEDIKPRRNVDHTAGDARRAVADVIARLEPLRSKVAVIYARTQRHCSEAEKKAMSDESREIKRAVEDARVELIDRLMDAPRKVLAHSRVADAERALDNLEVAINRCLEGLN